ncbi:chemotaxis protein CheW [Rhodoferax lithotrophicus]|uniref:Chemotaxis protein CheW n=1 Tax=Rhodoferax lithotrophicus TaxID=2798804 RepID=A0ABM7MG90_9BURK|nr:chemotaxis protein CheW [Rhodoferax sp. MIZ03]BCO25227.1 chemotaxis protein CheW [Rhodoferax sp. MIZ03]
MNTLVQTSSKDIAAQADAARAKEEKQYLTFILGGEMFSLSILCIKEIIWYANLTEVPMMPTCIRGVINLRGAVVPVMDLSNRFGKPSTPVIKSSCIVIVEVPTATEGEYQNMGIVVDSVQAVLEIPSSEIEPAPTFGAKIRSDFIEGIAKVNGKFVILLNVNRVLSMEEIGQMGQVAAMADVHPGST